MTSTLLGPQMEPTHVPILGPWDLQIKLTWSCSPSSRVSCSPSRVSACARNSAHKESAGSCSWSSKSTDSASSFAEACDKKNEHRKQIFFSYIHFLLYFQLVCYTEADTALRLYFHNEQMRLLKNILHWFSQGKYGRLKLPLRPKIYYLLTLLKDIRFFNLKQDISAKVQWC
jgi:hypothetical protein